MASYQRKLGDVNLVIDSQTGNLGVGTNDPVSTLHIKTSVDNSVAQGLVIERSVNTDRGYISYNGGGFQFRSTVGDPIVFGETDSEHMRILPDGNVGIGVDNPNKKLVVSDSSIKTDIGASEILRVAGTSQGVGRRNEIGFSPYDSNYNPHITLGMEYVSTAAYCSSDFYIATRALTTDTAPIERFRITSDGKVGIATNDPQTLLNINVGSGGTHGVAGLRIGATDNYPSLELGTYGAYGGMVRSYGNDLHYFAGHWRTIGNTASENHSHYWYTSKASSTDWSTVKMELDHNGNLGIGTTSPDGKLTVRDDNAGGAAKMIISNGGTVQSGTTARLSFYEGADEKSYIERRRDGTGITAFVTPADDNPFSFINASGEFIRMVNSKVGIGTTGPESPIHITSASNNENWMLLEVNDTYYKKIEFSEEYRSYGSGQYGGYIGYDGDNNLLSLGVYNGGTDSRAVNIKRDDGNVGIGTTSPGHALHVYADQNQPANIESPNPNTWLDLTSTGGTWSMGAANDNRWMVYQRTGTNATRMTINSSGNVGIGSASPAYLLDVNGAGRFTGKLYVETLDNGAQSDKFLVSNSNEVEYRTTAQVRSDLQALTYVYVQRYVTGSGGWHRISKIARGGARFSLSYTGGNFSPTNYAIDAYKNWSGESTIKVEKYGLANYIDKVRIVQELNGGSSDYYLEADFVSLTPGLNHDFRGYVQYNQGFSNTSEEWAADGNSYLYATDATANAIEEIDLSSTDGIYNSNIFSSDNISINGQNTNFNFYNNGTTYLNGATTIDANTTINGQLDINANATNKISFADDGAFTVLNADAVLRVNQRVEVWGGGSGKQYLDVRDQSGNVKIMLNAEDTSYFNNGLVGVGTTSPQGKLEVNVASTGSASDGYSLRYTSNQVHYWNLYDQFTSRFQIGSTAGNWRWDNSGGARMVLNADGNLGVGTTSPSQKLEVHGNIYGYYGELRLIQGYGITWNNGDNYIKGIGGYHLQFTTYDGSSAQVEVMRLTGGTAANGGARAGIGVTSPQAKLHVGGDAIFDGRIRGAELGNPDITRNGLTFYVDLNDKASHSGTSSTEIPIDLGPNGYTMALYGGANFEYKNGIGSFYFDNNGDILQIEDFYVGGTANTYEVWVYAENVAQGGSPWDTIWDSATERPLLGLYNGRPAAYPGTYASTGDAIDTGKWYQIVYAFASNSDIDIYVNGNRIIEAEDWSDGGSYTQRTGTFTSWIGGDTGVESFQGWIAIARHYDRQLAPEEVLQNYNADIRRFAANTPTLGIVQKGGSVGIGTDVPDATLDVKGNIRIPNEGKIVFGTAGTPNDYLELRDVNATGKILKLVQDGTTRFDVEGVTGDVYMQGNVGVGTTTPNPHSWGSKTVTIQAAGTNAYSAVEAYGTGTGAGALLLGAGSVMHASVQSVDGSHLLFTTNASNSGISQTEAMRITSSGNVGIGTTAPANTLHVKGAIISEDDSTTSTLYIGQANANVAEFVISPSDDTSANYFSFRPNSQNAGAGVRIWDRYEDDYLHLRHDNSRAHIATDSDGGDIYISPQGSTSIAAKSDGKVGIGTTSPGWDFDVARTSRFGDGIRVESRSGQGNWRAYYNVLDFAYDGNFAGAIILNTAIPRNSNEMLMIHVKGYGYGHSTTIDFKVVVYPYSGVNGQDGQPGRPYNYSIQDNGTDDRPKFIGINADDNLAIAIGDYNDGNKYYYRLSVDYHAARLGVDSYAIGWTHSQSQTAGFGWVDKRDLNAPIKTTLNGATTFNNAFTFPTSDGSSGQALVTNGSGTVSWGTVSGGSASTIDVTNQTSGTGYRVLFIDDTGTSGETIYVQDGGLEFDPGTSDLNVKGNVVSYATSDRRLKDNLKPIENASEKISKISGYEFDWNDKQASFTGHDVGVVAQEIEEVLPEVVTERKDGYKAVKYEKIVALLIEGMKEQQKEIEELKERINQLEK